MQQVTYNVNSEPVIIEELNPLPDGVAAPGAKNVWGREVKLMAHLTGGEQADRERGRDE